MLIPNRLPAITGLCLLLAACGGNDDADPQEPEPSPATDAPTWHADVAPIIHRSCTGCHHPDGIGQFSMQTWSEAAPLAQVIANSVSTGRMPPWGAQATETCAPRHAFKDDIRLTAEEIDLIGRWAEADAPEGDAAAAVELPAPSLDRLDGVQQELASAIPFTTVGTADQFRCFVLDPGLSEDAYIDAVHVIPGNPLVVHHALVYVDQGGEESIELADEDGGYDCFGGPIFDDPQLVAAWAPGAVPTVLPDGAGMRLDAGSRLVMQIHYHPTGPDDPQDDSTTLQLRYTDHTPEYRAFIALIGNFDGPEDEGGLLPGEGEERPEFFIPAGATGHVERMRYTIPSTYEDRPFPGMYLFGAASHMHYVGTDMSMRVVRPEKTAACDDAGVEPLRGCLSMMCDGVEPEDLVDCAVEHCAVHVAGATEDCRNCLAAQADGGEEDVFGPCTAVVRPTHYGPLVDQPADECLLQTPEWDFEWQRLYAYDAPIADLPFVEAGDSFEFECTFDNSMSNPFVRDALAQQGLDAPQDVVLGDETLDEMCLMVLGVLYKWPDE